MQARFYHTRLHEDNCIKSCDFFFKGIHKEGELKLYRY